MLFAFPCSSSVITSFVATGVDIWSYADEDFRKESIVVVGGVDVDDVDD